MKSEGCTGQESPGLLGPNPTVGPNYRPQAYPGPWLPPDLAPLDLLEALLHASLGKLVSQSGGTCPAKSHLSPLCTRLPRYFKTVACLCLANPEPSCGQGLPRALHRGVRPQLWTLDHAQHSSEPVTDLRNLESDFGQSLDQLGKWVESVDIAQDPVHTLCTLGACRNSTVKYLPGCVGAC